ncbi:MAG: ABC transporter ATP-binding protein [Planctomycetota bacterium]|nr:ABC transporter ATP-binding protein [Planctomycetota bacterium]
MAKDVAEPLLELKGLQTHFFSDEGTARAVDGVSYKILPGETLGVVGESGSGKSVTALSIMQLIPQPPGKIVGGEILFQGESLLKKTDAEMRRIRGNDIAMIFQEPMTALNPVFTVGDQIIETVMVHRGIDKAAARAHAIDMLTRVGIPSPETRVDEYPHQLSGGMRQRVMIAIAMSCDPKLLIADEPTTALDVTIQAQILDLIRELQDEAGMSVLLITHDLAVVAEVSHHVAVMYAGKVVECASGVEVVERPAHPDASPTWGAFLSGFLVGFTAWFFPLPPRPAHPYAIGLFRSLPDLAGPGERLVTIPGMVPPATRFPAGCRFHPRCPIATDKCRTEEPPLAALESSSPLGRTLACHHIEEATKL